MRTLDYLFDPVLAPLYRPGVFAGVAISLAAGPLSVFVVLKRLAFIGQGISHAAFGGIGIAAILGLTATQIAPAPAGGLWQFLVVLGFCLSAGLGVGLLSDRAVTREDTAIGIVLVSSMALGALLLHFARTGLAWESFLFGSIFNIAMPEAVGAWVVAIGLMGALGAVRRPMIFWAFDEPAARAFGVNTGVMKSVLLILLSVATVASMKLAGVVLATAMLVLPGACALQLSRRLGPVIVISTMIAFLADLAGLVISFEFDLQPGPGIVLVLAFGFLMCKGWRKISGVFRRDSIRSDGA